jgi:predicted RNA binding protein YcfA (HicA-like mRNA interferase family)
MGVSLLKTYFYSVLFSASLITGTVAQAGEIIEKRMPVLAGSHVFIKNDRGDVDVKGWDKAEILVKGELANDSQELILKNKDGKTFIVVNTTKGSHRGYAHSGGSSDLEVFVPQNVKLHFKGIDTDFAIEGLLAEIKGNTINGELLIKNVHAHINVSSITGDINVSDSSGSAHVESVRGDVNVKGEFEDVNLQTVAGDIWTDISNTENLKTNNVTGSTIVEGHLLKDASIALVSVNGDIDYNVAGILNAEFEMTCQVGGDINNNLTDDLPNKSQMQTRKLRFVLGDGSGSVIIKTIVGTISIDN